MSFDGPEIERRHRSGALPMWLEWLTSVSALVISISSIFIAVHNGRDEDKMVQAQSFPYVEISIDKDRSMTPGSNELAESGKLSLNLTNQGVGPAYQQSLTIKVSDHYVSSVHDLIATVVGPTEAPEAIKAIIVSDNIRPTRFFPANKEQYIFVLGRNEKNARWWDMISQSRSSWSVDICYCSVFKECWTRHNDDEPAPVKACHRNEAHEFH